jgi:hypothetical protein
MLNHWSQTCHNCTGERLHGKVIIERSVVVFRSTDFPKMKFNQFMMLRYFHDGVPHDQALWIDELAVGAKRIGATLRPERTSDEH